MHSIYEKPFRSMSVQIGLSVQQRDRRRHKGRTISSEIIRVFVSSLGWYEDDNDWDALLLEFVKSVPKCIKVRRDLLRALVGRVTWRNPAREQMV